MNQIKQPKLHNFLREMLHILNSKLQSHKLALRRLIFLELQQRYPCNKRDTKVCNREDHCLQRQTHIPQHHFDVNKNKVKAVVVLFVYDQPFQHCFHIQKEFAPCFNTFERKTHALHQLNPLVGFTITSKQPKDLENFFCILNLFTKEEINTPLRKQINYGLL